MQVSMLAVQHVFEKDVLYRVPLYQRPYVWNEEDQWLPLWEDLQRLAESILAGGNPRAHFLGATVQDRVAVPPGHIETRLLIDGQQRITSLQILLKSFEDIVRQLELTRYADAIGKLVRNHHPLSNESYEAFKVWPTNADRADFTAIMETTSRAALTRDYGARVDVVAIGRTLIDAYLYFSREIGRWIEDAAGAETRVAALYGAIRDNVRMVVIDLDEKDDAQLIFETLNARGTPLLAADLVKNALLNEIQQSGGNTELAYQKYWQPFDQESAFWRERTGRGHAQRARIEIFLQHALTIMSGSEVQTAHLYSFYRDFSRTEAAGTPLDRLGIFKRFGSIYRSLLKGSDQPRIALFLERVQVLGLESIYPFLIKLVDRLVDDEASIIAIIRDLESFLVRRMIARLNTRGYNNLFVGLLPLLDGPPETLQALLREDLLSKTAEVDRWPDDDEFGRAWLEYPLYENLTRPRLRMVLEALEGGLRNDFAESEAIPRNLTIEHVLPQAWQATWPLPADALPETIAKRERLLHTIGNLTLLKGKFNIVQSNKPWVDESEPALGKRCELEAHTVLHMNKSLCKYLTWEESTIIERGAVLFEVARMIWPRP